jgi:hypothetical protein
MRLHRAAARLLAALTVLVGVASPHARAQTNFYQVSDNTGGTLATAYAPGSGHLVRRGRGQGAAFGDTDGLGPDPGDGDPAPAPTALLCPLPMPRAGRATS